MDIQTLPEGRLNHLQKKILFTLGFIAIYRIGVYVPIPGINTVALGNFFRSQGGNMLGMFNMFSGGALANSSIFALGVTPYISSSIIFQLLTVVVPYLEALSKEGEAGRRKITQYTRYGTVVLALIQAYMIVTPLSTVDLSGEPLVLSPTTAWIWQTVISLAAGTAFVMWLGEKISDHGLGNGISLIIMVGILASAPHVFNIQLSYLMEGSLNPITQLIPSILLMVAITIFVVLVTTAVRKIPVQYAKRVVGRKVYGGQSTHLPLKILTAGVMPIIFAQALMFLPNTIGQLFQGSIGSWVLTVFSPDHWFYALVLSIFIIIFTYFYTAIAFNPVDVADNMKKQGGFIPGVRPGKPTADYIDNILTKVTLPAAIFLAFIACIPTFLVMFAGMDFSLASFYGGTSLLIIVGVALDTLQQIESHLITRHYDGFLKSGKIQGRSRKRY